MCYEVSTPFGCDSRSPGEMRRFATTEMSGLPASRPERRGLLDAGVAPRDRLVCIAVALVGVRTRKSHVGFEVR